MIIYQKELDSSFQAVDKAVKEAEKAFLTLGSWFDSSKRFTTLFLLRELLNNAVEHGNRFHSDKKVLLQIALEDFSLQLEVKDEGQGITLPEVNFDSEDQENLLRTRNRGYQLLSQLATEIIISDNQVKVRLDFNQED
ncbi:MAG: ATP-binding protein [Vallitaleaceae bacterium]|nr:ATP-binding protein [Vallitaleaceae bacterium]